MNGAIFAQGLMSASGTELRTLYALLVETKLTSLIATKAKELFKKDVDHFNELLQKEVQKLELIPDDELRLRLFLHFTKILDLEADDYTQPSALESKCEEIVSATHELMLKDKIYNQFATESETELTSHLIVQFQMQQVFNIFDQKLRQASVQEKEAFINKIAEFLTTLSTEQQLALQERFRVERFDQESTAEAVNSYGTVAVLSGIVEVAGVRAYTSLISAIATSPTILGLSMPLGIYTGAASLLLIVSNPIFIMTLGLGGGGLLLYRQNKKLRQSLLPMGLLQLLLPVMIKGEQTYPDFTPLIKEWHKKLALQQMYTDKLQAAQNELASQKAVVASHNTKIHHHTNKVQQWKANIEDLKVQLGERLTALTDAEKSETYQSLTTQINEIEGELIALRKNLASKKEKAGLFKSIGHFFDNSSMKSKVKQLEKKKIILVEERIHAVIEMAPAVFQDDLSEMKNWLHMIEEAEKEIDLLQSEKKERAQQINQLKNTIYEIDTVLEKHQKDFHGVKKMQIEGKET